MSEERANYKTKRGGRRPGSGAPTGNTNAQKSERPRRQWTARLDLVTIAKIKRLAKEAGISQGELIDKIVGEVNE